MDQQTIDISNMHMRIAELERQNADLLAANNAYLKRARDAEFDTRVMMAWSETFRSIAPDMIGDVTAFHAGCGTVDPQVPTVAPANRRDLRISLITEEVVNELFPALRAGDLVKIADGIADGIYVLIGTALAYGIPLADVWREVQRSNMSKFHPDTGKPVLREDGKILKGEWFSPADIAGILEAA